MDTHIANLNYDAPQHLPWEFDLIFDLQKSKIKKVDYEHVVAINGMSSDFKIGEYNVPMNSTILIGELADIVGQTLPVVGDYGLSINVEFQKA